MTPLQIIMNNIRLRFECRIVFKEGYIKYWAKADMPITRQEVVDEIVRFKRENFFGFDSKVDKIEVTTTTIFDMTIPEGF